MVPRDGIESSPEWLILLYFFNRRFPAYPSMYPVCISRCASTRRWHGCHTCRAMTATVASLESAGRALAASQGSLAASPPGCCTAY